MLRADRRVVVSHVGSLVRPPAMIPYLEKIRDKEPYDEAEFDKCLTDSVAEVVRLQAEAGKRLAIAAADDGDRRVFRLFRRIWPPGEAGEALADIEGSVDRFAVLTDAHDVDARFALKPHCLGNRVGEAFFERCLVVGLFIANFFQIRDHGRRPHQATDMAYDDATIRLQHISPPRYNRCSTGTCTVSSKLRDGIMNRLI